MIIKCHYLSRFPYCKGFFSDGSSKVDNIGDSVPSDSDNSKGSSPRTVDIVATHHERQVTEVAHL